MIGYFYWYSCIYIMHALRLMKQIVLVVCALDGEVSANALDMSGA
jgi:hypothetical protein